MTETLHFISHCGSTWLVGISGKDITSADTGGGRFGEVPLMSIGNDEIGKCEDLKDRSPCRKCGKMVKVEIARPTGEKDEL